MKNVFLIGMTFLVVLSFSFCRKEEGVIIDVIGENTSNLAAIKTVTEEYYQVEGVSIRFHENTFEDAFNKINSDFTTKSGLYDIVMQYNFSLSSFLRNDYVYTLAELEEMVPSTNEHLHFEKELFSNAWKEVGYYYEDPTTPESQIQKISYPFATNTMLMIYNRELFSNPKYQYEYEEKFGSKLSPPETWDEYKRIAEFFTRPDEEIYGVVLEGATGAWLYYDFMNFFFGLGAKTMDKEHGWEIVPNNNVTINSENGVKALEFFHSLKPYSAGDFYSVGQFEKAQLLRTGKVAMAFVWSDTILDIIRTNKTGSYDNRFGFAPIPGVYSMLAGGAFFVSKQTKHPKEAYQYILFLMQPKMQIELAKNGLQSACSSVYQDPNVREIPYATALKESLQRGVYMLEAGAESDAVSNIFTEEIHKVWRGRQTEREAIEIIHKRTINTRTELLRTM